MEMTTPKRAPILTFVGAGGAWCRYGPLVPKVVFKKRLRLIRRSCDCVIVTLLSYKALQVESFLEVPGALMPDNW